MVGRDQLAHAGAVALAFCPEARGPALGALYGLCERAAEWAMPRRGVTWRAGVEVLYRHYTQAARDGAEIARRLHADQHIAYVAAWRLRRAGVL
jgi:hypothetical protein